MAAGSLSATPDIVPGVRPTPTGHVATEDELAQARAEWKQSAHSDTYDGGLGANTTCARCKSPQNWDPAAPAVHEAQNCAACKRVPGAPRPDLPTGVPVPKDEWKDITCDICHRRIADSYSTAIAFWNQATGEYMPVEDESELCAKCHEERHGFHVIEEQETSPAHTGWACSRCHGTHGTAASCNNCHDPTRGKGATSHAMHPQVNCTACHDAGHLSIWRDTNPDSRHFGQYIPVRFAHTITSWPSHNLQVAVKCERCHHPRGEQLPAIAPTVSCQGCHPRGAVLEWCSNFPRDRNPNAVPSPSP